MRRVAPLAVAALMVLAGCLSGADPIGGTDAPDPDGPGPGDVTAYAPGWPDISEASIRPGAPILGQSCTGNFIFSTPDNRTLYLGTAGHCVDDMEVGDPVAIDGIDGAGTVAYCSLCMDDNPPDNDFALVEIADDHRAKVHPAMRGFRGPPTIDDDVSQGDKVLTFGNTPYREPAGDRLDAREGYVTDTTEWEVGFYLAGPGLPGDSGSPVITPDGALGVLVTLEIAPMAGGNNAVRLQRALDHVNDNTDLTVELKTWSDVAGGELP